MSGWHLQGVDLTERGTALRSLDVAGALFLGCRLTEADAVSVRARGAIVFPELPGLPIDTYRTTLYTPTELFGSGDYQDSLDACAYAWSQQVRNLDVTLAQALHDHAIDDAVEQYVVGRSLVGVMGGHSLRRGGTSYLQAAELGQRLAGAHTVATGGGPGAMEAANLGAWMRDRDAAELGEAVRMLGTVPSFTPSIGAWADAAFGVRDRFPDGAESLGVPTWHYGHEPPNPFATSIAKYFANPQREAVLLQICNAGIVFLPGAAGTVQEIFTDACENYYADESATSPMVLVGRQYWTETLPAWPLLQALASGRHMADRVHLVDTTDEVAALLT